MLKVDPDRRPTARELLDFDWFKVSLLPCSISGRILIFCFVHQGSGNFEAMKKNLPPPLAPSAYQNTRLSADTLTKKHLNTEWHLSVDSHMAERRCSHDMMQSGPSSSNVNTEETLHVAR
jgi:hypothetical protein